MQTICIEKVTKLEKAYNKAKSKLKEAEERKDFLVEELREQLHTYIFIWLFSLERRVQEQKLEREQRELKMRIKAEKEKAKLEQEK